MHLPQMNQEFAWPLPDARHLQGQTGKHSPDNFLRTLPYQHTSLQIRTVHTSSDLDTEKKAGLTHLLVHSINHRQGTNKHKALLHSCDIITHTTRISMTPGVLIRGGCLGVMTHSKDVHKQRTQANPRLYSTQTTYCTHTQIHNTHHDR